MAALIDLPLILNMDEQIPALRRVRALDQLLMLDLPPLSGGATLKGTLHLCDGAGDIIEESGAANMAPVLIINCYNAGVLQTLAIVTDFTLIATDPKGWGFFLRLTSEELASYLGADGEAREAIFELSIAPAGNLKLLYRRACTLMPWVQDSATSMPIALNSPILRSDITSAALHRAVATVGRVLPTVFMTLESATWCTWTLRAREVGEDDDGTSYRVPDDYDADDNDVIWVRTSIT